MGNVAPKSGGNSAAPRFWGNVSHDFWETLPRFNGKRFPKLSGNVTPKSKVTFPRVCLDKDNDAQQSRNDFIDYNIIKY